MKITQKEIVMGNGFLAPTEYTKPGQKSVHVKQLTIIDYSSNDEFSDVNMVSATEKQLFKSYRTAILQCDDWYTEKDVLAALKGKRIGRIMASEPIISARQKYNIEQGILDYETVAEKQLVPMLTDVTAEEKAAGVKAVAILDADGKKVPMLDVFKNRQYRLLTVINGDKKDVDLRVQYPLSPVNTDVVDEDEDVNIPVEDHGDFA
jgi:hypothetical protein